MIPLDETLVRLLVDHRRAQAEHAMKLGRDYARLDLVFPNELGLPQSAKNILRRHFRKVLERAGLPTTLRLYSLRHSHATALLAAGIDAKVAASRLGHSSIRTTCDTYQHVSEAMQREATARIERALFS